ncbi:hypothetical protein [Lactobacillus xylocopicola]|uniref:Surface layer protein A domain-containing protein n=1 Tax=Lactobacillus xylocopicola TaxID=2976676 RepID=A0ABM8BIX7_9LACO|nr:hypothetical protein [Lactobacillus xylocopicola]BDR61054.1 hypothetical protein KIM322_13150 [Lactobacillus xylocopicola]
MKKIKKILITLAALVTVGGASSAALSLPRAVQAQTTKTATVFPKKMRGTWYSYDTTTKKVNKLKFTKKTQISFDEQGQKLVQTLHSKKTAPLDPQFDQDYVNWIVIAGQPKAHGRKWLSIEGFDHGAGAGVFYNVARLKGHQVLSTAVGAGIWQTKHAYKTAKLAQKFQQRHYPHFEY